jgi:hypothetical protein
VFVPILVAAILATCIAISITGRRWIALKELLEHRRLWRGIVTVIPIVSFGLVLPAFLDRAMIADLRAGRMLTDYVTSLTYCIIATAVFAWSQAVMYFINDTAIEAAKSNEILANDMKQFAAYRLGVSQAFLGVVKLKANRVASKLATLNGSTTIDSTFLKAALLPQEQIGSLLAAVHSLLMVTMEGGPGEEIRVIFYEAEGDYLVPKLATDGQGVYDPTHQFQQHREKFKLSEPECLPAYVARHGTLEIEPDIEQSARLKPHCQNHTRDWFRSRSMVAVPLGKRNATGMPAVLTFESQSPNFFRDSGKGRSEIDLLVDNVRERLLFECDMNSLLSRLSG